jgi:formylglycine-generating enzyme required for sulfatase activity
MSKTSALLACLLILVLWCVKPTAPEAARVRTSMVQIPGGALKAGGVQVGPFWMAKTEVTVREYASCVAVGKCTAPKTRWKTCNWADRQARGDHPVNCIDWHQANAYCSWAGLRLPTEQEWEFAARGSDGRTYPRGEDPPNGRACVKGDDSGTCPVGNAGGDVSPLGLVDIAGNVKEWTASSEKLPGGVDAKVFRGGGWHYDRLSPVVPVRTTELEFLPPTEFAADLGVRCASSTPPRQ